MELGMLQIFKHFPKCQFVCITGATDWKFVFTVIPDTLKALHDKGL